MKQRKIVSFSLIFALILGMLIAPNQADAKKKKKVALNKKKLTLTVGKSYKLKLKNNKKKKEKFLLFLFCFESFNKKICKNNFSFLVKI